ncbi:MAG: response regulator, partial [Dehalococcoidia bacterium]
RAMLELESDFHVAGEADSAEAAIRDLEVLDVDVVLMDIRLPGMNGVEAMRILKDKRPELIIVALTSYSDEYLGPAIEAGASGYLLKSCTRQRLVQCVRDAANGDSPIDPALAGGLLRELAELRRTHRQMLLTPRQIDILSRAANGVRYREISQELFISESTVNREIRSIFDQLGVNDLAHAVYEAQRRHII